MSNESMKSHVTDHVHRRRTGAFDAFREAIASSSVENRIGSFIDILVGQGPLSDEVRAFRKSNVDIDDALAMVVDVYTESRV